MLEIHLHETKQVVIAVLKGRIDSEGAQQLERTFPEGKYDRLPLLLDLSGTSFLSSLGVRTLVRLRKARAKSDYPITLAGVQPFVLDTLRTTGLLNLFHLEPDVSRAMEKISSISGPTPYSPAVLEATDPHFRWQELDSGRDCLDLWGLSRTIPDGTGKGPVALQTVSLQELGLAWGIGGLGRHPEEAEEAEGPFLASGYWVAVQPRGTAEADFLLAPHPGEAYFHVRQALSFRGEPAVRITALQPAIPLCALLDHAAREVRRRFALPCSAPFGFLILGRRDSRRLVLAGIAAARERLPLADDETAEICSMGHSREIQGCTDRFFGTCFLFSENTPEPHPGEHWKDLLKQMLSLETEILAADWMTDWKLEEAAAWLFVPSEVRSAEDARLKVHRADGKPFPFEWECLARNVYSDSLEILADPLPGGYSSTTFRVSGWDAQQRKMLPTVLKISTRDWIEREEKAYKECVRPFILNNSAVIMGKAQMGEWAALRYNFVGLNGPDTRLTWLGDLLIQRSFEDLRPVLDSLFGKILYPWYGQTRLEPTFLFREHDPRGLFPRMEEDAESLLGIGREDEEMDCPELGMRLPNPFRAIRILFEDRMQDRRVLHRSITHGDLNLNNILIDDRENIYIIDFSETGIRNVASDFARMEALTLLQMTRLETEEDLSTIALQCRALIEVRTLTEKPCGLGSSNDPMMEKILSLIGLLREYAAGYAPGQSDLWAYWLPLLQWSAPIVSFRQYPPQRKRLAAIAAGLICRRLMSGR